MRSDLLAAVFALLLAAVVVTAGVVGLAATLLPEPGAVAPEAAAPVTSIPSSGEAPAAPAIVPPSEPPDLPGAVIEVTGDREEVIDLRPPPGEPANGVPSEDSRFTIEAGGDSLRFGSDPEAGLYLDQANLAGMNLFLDPGDCSLQEVASSEDTGTAVLSMTCPDVSDAQGANTVSIDGYVAVPLNLTATYETGGKVVLTGDVTAEAEWPFALWYVQEEQDSATHEVVAVTNAFEVANYDDTGNVEDALILGVDDAGTPFVREVRVAGEKEALLVEEGACPATVTPLARIAPDTEYLELAIACDDVGTGGREVDLAGTLRVQRVTMTFHYFNG